jgi:hypothetical protein
MAAAPDVLGSIALEGPGTILVKDSAQLPAGFAVPWMLRAFVSQGHRVGLWRTRSRECGRRPRAIALSPPAGRAAGRAGGGRQLPGAGGGAGEEACELPRGYAPLPRGYRLARPDWALPLRRASGHRCRATARSSRCCRWCCRTTAAQVRSGRAQWAARRPCSASPARPVPSTSSGC